MNRVSNLPFLLFFLLLTSALQAQQNFKVHFTNGTEVFGAISSSDAIQKPDTEEIINGTYVRYLQFNTLLSGKEKANLEAQGLQFMHYITYGAYLTAIPKDFDLQTLANLRSVQAVQTKWKLHKSLLTQPYGAWAKSGDNLDIIVQIYPTADLEVSAELLKEMEYKILFTGKQNHWMKIQIPETDVETVAALPFIKHLELQPAPAEAEDTRGSALHRSNLINSDAPMGRKYDGTGIGVLIRDDGYLGPHIDFHGRLTDLQTSNSAVEHADGVAGILTGAGNLNPYMKGMASGASIFNIQYVADFEDITLPLHLNDGVKVTNSSYSNGCNDGYTVTTQTVDKQMFENPTLLHVFSAGNSNGLDCDYGAGNQWGNITGGHKQGKNVIATANLGQDFVLESSSSRGPAHDGRIKPDISANGFGHFSTDPDNTYAEFGGTSAASPGIAGCAAQLMQAHYELFGTEAPSALIKIALLNAANDLGNVGPDYKYGWGHVNAFRSLRVFEKNNFWSAQLEHDSIYTQTIDIPAGLTEARIMLYWAEPESAENAARALLNDLDLVLIAPDSSILQPWLLNPTPNATTLNNPAGHGRDSLNNVEQVAIFNPAAGTYTIQVKGFEVPFGPQKFYIAYEERDAKPKMVYPNGGEGLIPGDEVRIHWDSDPAYTGLAELSYSTDNGATWAAIGTSLQNRRHFDWIVPSIISNTVQVQVTTGAVSDTSDFAISIVDRPTNVAIVKVCPDSIFVGFTGVNDTLQHDVYLLGEKFMEIKATASAGQSVIGFPNSDPTQEQWAAVRASHPNGLRGERTIAVSSPGGLLNCSLAFDLEQTSILAPMETSFVNCGPLETEIKIGVRNVGLNAISGGTISYQLGDAAPVTENLIDLDVNEFTIHTFAAPATLDTIAMLDFKAWINHPNDTYSFNDSLSTSWQVVTRIVNQIFTEDFEAAAQNFPVEGWSIGNPDGEITWQALQVTGIDDQPTWASFMDFFSYSDREQEDALIMVPVDLTTIPDAALRFDVAYTSYEPTGYSDGLRVEALPGCDVNATPVVIYEKYYPELATAPTSTTEWLPSNGTEWRTELKSLAGLSGPTLIRFVSINNYGNSLFLDNIGLESVIITLPEANYSVSADTVCKAESLVISDLSTGDNLNYNWNFGVGAIPQTANTAGPHTVRYLTSFGDKTIQLILSSPGGVDTLTHDIFVFNTPTANFSSTISNDTVQFANTSSYGESYLWDFGDGNTSTDINPVHIYGMIGDYDVTLTTINRCDTIVRTKVVNVATIIGLQELPEGYIVQVGPNPNKGQFIVQFQSPNRESVQMDLRDAAGRLVAQRSLESFANTMTTVPFEKLGLANGFYFLYIKTSAGEKVVKIAVQD